MVVLDALPPVGFNLVRVKIWDGDISPENDCSILDVNFDETVIDSVSKSDELGNIEKDGDGEEVLNRPESV